MTAKRRRMFDKKTASPGRIRKATIANDTAATAATIPWVIGPSKKMVTGVARISKTRMSSAKNI